MLRCLACAIAAAMLNVFSGAAWGLPPVTADQGVRALVGTYQCVTHDGSQTWHFGSVNTMWGAWLHAATTFAAQNGQPPDNAVTFVGFDSSAKRWNIVSIDTDGSYYTRYSHSRTFNPSQWRDGYPADGAKAIIGLPSPQQYSFDLTTQEKDGRSTTSRTLCTRS